MTIVVVKVVVVMMVPSDGVVGYDDMVVMVIKAVLVVIMKILMVIMKMLCVVCMKFSALHQAQSFSLYLLGLLKISLEPLIHE